MNKCSIINDILPIYIDGICSQESKLLVEEHIKTCEKCKRKLENMQDEIKVCFKHEYEDETNINVLKSIRKKIFKKNVLVALISVAVSIAVLIGVGNYIFSHLTIIPYEKGLVTVEVHTTNVVENEDGTNTIIDPYYAEGYDADGNPITMTENNRPFVVKNVLDVSCSKNSYCINSAGKVFIENGQRIEIIFLNFSKTISTDWEKKSNLNRFARIVEPNFDNQPINRYEVYYLNSDVNELSDTMSIDEYRKISENGILIWSGKLE